MKYQTENFVKAFELKNGPEGLYPWPIFLTQNTDLEGFSGQFAYKIITETGCFHPIEGMVVHPYDEILCFGSIYDKDMLYLGAEISIELGEEREEYIFTEPTIVTIPAGVPHGPVCVRRLYKPFAHFFFGLAGEYAATSIKSADQKSCGGKYAHLVKRFACTPGALSFGSGMGYDPSDKYGIMRPEFAPPGMLGPGNADEMVWLFGNDLEGFKLNFLFGHYSKAGKWHRDGEAHTHPEEEILIWVGFNPDNPYELGAEIEMGLGENDDRYIFSVPTVIIAPKGVPHLPEITRWADRTYGFMVFSLDDEHRSPWIDSEGNEYEKNYTGDYKSR